jgi:transposase
MLFFGHTSLNFPRGSTFTCPECGQAEIKAYDTQEKSWRHLNFFQHEAYLSARKHAQADKFTPMSGVHNRMQPTDSRRG